MPQPTLRRSQPPSSLASKKTGAADDLRVMQRNLDVFFEALRFVSAHPVSKLPLTPRTLPLATAPLTQQHQQGASAAVAGPASPASPATPATPAATTLVRRWQEATGEDSSSSSARSPRPPPYDSVARRDGSSNNTNDEDDPSRPPPYSEASAAATATGPEGSNTSNSTGTTAAAVAASGNHRWSQLHGCSEHPQSALRSSASQASQGGGGGGAGGGSLSGATFTTSASSGTTGNTNTAPTTSLTGRTASMTKTACLSGASWGASSSASNRTGASASKTNRVSIPAPFADALEQFRMCATNLPLDRAAVLSSRTVFRHGMLAYYGDAGERSDIRAMFLRRRKRAKTMPPPPPQQQQHPKGAAVAATTKADTTTTTNTTTTNTTTSGIKRVPAAKGITNSGSGSSSSGGSPTVTVKKRPSLSGPAKSAKPAPATAAGRKASVPPPPPSRRPRQPQGLALEPLAVRPPAPAPAPAPAAIRGTSVESSLCPSDRGCGDSSSPPSSRTRRLPSAEAINGGGGGAGGGGPRHGRRSSNHGTRLAATGAPTAAASAPIPVGTEHAASTTGDGGGDAESFLAASCGPSLAHTLVPDLSMTSLGASVNTLHFLGSSSTSMITTGVFTSHSLIAGAGGGAQSCFNQQSASYLAPSGALGASVVGPSGSFSPVSSVGPQRGGGPTCVVSPTRRTPAATASPAATHVDLATTRVSTYSVEPLSTDGGAANIYHSGSSDFAIMSCDVSCQHHPNDGRDALSAPPPPPPRPPRFDGTYDDYDDHNTNNGTNAAAVATTATTATTTTATVIAQGANGGYPQHLPINNGDDDENDGAAYDWSGASSSSDDNEGSGVFSKASARKATSVAIRDGRGGGAPASRTNKNKTTATAHPPPPPSSSSSAPASRQKNSTTGKARKSSTSGRDDNDNASEEELEEEEDPFSSTANLRTIQEIIPGLWCGSYVPATNRAYLQSHGITHVCCCIDAGQFPFPADFTYFKVPVTDSNEADIGKYFGRTFEFIEGALIKEHGAVLVHCGAGISRAPTVTAAYLVRKLHLGAAAAVGLIQQRRPFASPNQNFRRQLREYAHRMLVGQRSEARDAELLLATDRAAVKAIQGASGEAAAMEAVEHQHGGGRAKGS